MKHHLPTPAPMTSVANTVCFGKLNQVFSQKKEVNLFTTIIFSFFFILLSQSVNAQIAAWNFFGAASPVTWPSSTFNANLVSTAGANNVTRGAGAAASAGSNSFRTQGFQNNGIAVTNTDYFQVTLTAATGFSLSLSTIDAKFNGTTSFAVAPGVSHQFAYSLNGTTFTLIGSPTVTVGATTAFPTVNVSSITALQNVPSGTTVTLRYYASGQTSTGGWGFFSASAASTDNGLSIGGSVTVSTGVASKLAITSISPASPSQFNNFSVTVQSQDVSNALSNVVANTSFVLSVATGTGSLGGTITGTILAGTNSITLNSVTYNTVESGVSLTATQTAGDPLTPGTSGTFNVQTPVPTILLTGTLTPFSTIIGTPSTTQSYTVSGSTLGLTDIVITPPVDFEIKTGAGSFSTSAINLTPSGGSVATTTIDVRYNPAVVGSTTGNSITHVSGAASQSLAVSGSSTELEPTLPSAITFGTLTSYSAVINFSGGNGTSRIIVMVQGAGPVVYVPGDGFGPTGVNSNFPSASSQGSLNRIVYSGNANTVTVTGLNPTTQYAVRVYEYNGAASTTNYLTSAFGDNSFTTPVYAAIHVPMASQGGYTYTENFGDIANWGDNFNGGTGAQYWSAVAVNATGTIPNGTKITAATNAFATISSGGVQRGSLSPNPAGTIVLLSTGSTDNSSACAIDFRLDYTGLNAGTLSFDWSVVLNSSTGRLGSLRIYTSPDGITYTELPAAAVIDFSSASSPASGQRLNIALPASLNNSATARIRFYEYNGGVLSGPTGNRPKISVDNVIVTGTLPAPPDHLAISSISPASPAQNGTFSVTVQSQDPSNVASNVVANTDVTLQYTGGTGTLSGTLTGQITAGTNSITFTGLSYDVAETFTLTAHRTAGDVLADGSSSITILAPVITLTGTLATFSTGVGSPSAAQTYTVAGVNLTAGIVLTPPQTFEISTNGFTWVDYTSSITLPQTAGVVPTTTIYVQYNPLVAGPNSGNISHTSTGAVTQNEAVSGTTTIPEPTINSTITFGCNTGTSMIINFTGGNGSSRIVVMKAAASVSYIPSDGIAATGVNNIFSSAADQGSGDRIVYDGSGSTVTVSGLTAATSYAIAIYEYNGSGATADYLSTPATATGLTTGGVSYSSTGGTYTQNFNGLPNTGAFNTTGFGSGPFYLSECPVGSGNLSGWQYGRTGGTGTDVKFNFDNGSATTGAVYSYGTSAASDRALGSLSTGTTINNYGLVLTNNTPDVLTSVTISYTGEQWRNGGGTGIPNTLLFSYSLNGTGILNGTYTPVPALDFVSPTVSTTAATLDGNLPANQTAKTATFTLNGNWIPGANLVLRFDDPNDISNDHGLAIDDFSFTAVQATTPSVQDHDISFSSIATTSMTANWINGDGQNRIVVMSTSNSFTNPSNGNTYSANTVYTGTGYGAPGEQVVYNGTGTSVSVTGLNPNTEYWFRVYSYNASGAQSIYLTSTANLNPNSQFTSSLNPPDHLAIISVNGGVGVDVVKNQTFSVVVQAQDATNVPQAVTTTTGVSLSVAIGSGTLVLGNITGSIAAGQNSTTVTGVIYDLADLGVSLQADQTSGTPVLTFGTSAAFNVVEGASSLVFDTLPPYGVVNTTVGQIRVKAIRPDLSVDQYFTGPITISVTTGAGTITGNLVNAVAGIATFNSAVFNATGPYTLTATSGALTSPVSNTIYITNPPVLNELVVPQYIGAKTTFVAPPGSSTNVDRTPIAVCLQFDNLAPNMAFDIRIGVEDATVVTGYGGSNIWTGAAFTGNIITNAFTTDANGSSPAKWIYIQPATSRFEPGMIHNLRIGYVKNGLVMPTAPILTSVKTITALDIQNTARTSGTADDGAFLKGSSPTCIGGKYILFYDNTAGNGQPLYSYQARQMDATNTQQSGLPTSVDDVFRQSGTSAVGDYAGVIPSNNPNGVQRIEVRNADNSILNYTTDADGVWGTVSTVNPVRRSVATLTSALAPLNTVEISGITSTPAGCIGNDGTATVTASQALNTNPVGTLSYAWSPSSQIVNPATGLTPNSYTVTVTNTTGGCTATASMSVGAPTLSTVTPSGPTSFCAPGSVTLTAGNGGTSWIWYKDNVATGDVGQSISASTTGTYTVLASDGLGCSLTSAPIPVIVNTFGYTGVFYSENMGAQTGNQNINTYTGWQNTAPIVYTTTGTAAADVRTTSTSNTYTGASGGGNVFLTTASGTPTSSDRNFIISGINTLGYSGITMTFGLRRDPSTTFPTSTDPIFLDYSTDGTTFNPLTFAQPTVSGAWGLVTVTGTIPNAANLRLRFSKTSSQVSFRIDDVKLSGTTTTVNIGANGPVDLCPGSSVRLSSNIPLNNPPTNVWSNAAITKSILVSTAGAGTYSVTVSDVNGCASTSAPVVVNALVVDDGNVCTTDACNSVTGVVTNTPISVDDNNACTTDACDPVTGTSHTPVNTNDNNVCTTDACNPVTGVSHTAISVDDNNACTTDACDPVTGASHTPVNTDDNNVCTTDACDPVTGVSHTAISVDDNNVCTTDACDPVTGISHTPISVDDNDACTNDGCDPVTGIYHTPICGVTLYTKVMIEGYYQGNYGLSTLMDNGGGPGAGGCLYLNGGSLDPTDADTLTISAMDAVTFAEIESQTGTLKTDGSVIVSFSGAVTSGSSYYIRIKHRNALETWSANPVMLSATTALLPYDFTSAQTQAYGNNMILSLDGLYWTIYSGDISDAATQVIGLQDGLIESQDYGDMENAISAYLSGYVYEDITGDLIVESLDYSIIENNLSGYVNSIHP
jgi:hypothetical protein